MFDLFEKSILICTNMDLYISAHVFLLCVGRDYVHGHSMCDGSLA